MSKAKLIIIDDEVDLANFVSELAKREGFITETFYSGKTFMNGYTIEADVIILDLMMPDMDGIEIIRYLSKFSCNAHLILMSGVDSGVLHSAEQLAKAQKLNFLGSIKKPFRQAELIKLLNSLSLISQKTSIGCKSELPSSDELQKALNNDELLIYYQPKINLTNGNMAVEALVRWMHPRHGLLCPNMFIKLAENEGMIDDLTWIVMNKSMKQCSIWNKLGMDIKVSINMSAITLIDLSIPEHIEKLIKKYNLKPSQIILEVTETALMEKLTTSLDILTRLRLKGIELSIDDFGTGFSSLVQLHRVPFSEIKIDQSFVMNMHKDIESKIIAETVIALGHKLNMKVVAEGVETKETLEELKQMGCDIVQGYFISKPKSKDIITKWLISHIERHNDIKTLKY